MFTVEVESQGATFGGGARVEEGWIIEGKLRVGRDGDIADSFGNCSCRLPKNVWRVPSSLFDRTRSHMKLIND